MLNFYSVFVEQSKLFKFEDKIPAFSARLSVLITVLEVFNSNSFFLLSDSILSQKNIQKNKLRPGSRIKQLKIFKFEEKIPAFSARLSGLITFFQVFDFFRRIFILFFLFFID
jgi:hypothetical protein